VDTTLNDYGRMRITKNKQDSLKFKVPTLRNIEFSFPYMHDGRFKTLSAVLKHYTNGVKQSPSLSVHLQKPIVLSSNDKVDLTAFLLTLTDKSFLFNSKYAYPKK
jgi:cytochrome c peroxidase